MATSTATGPTTGTDVSMWNRYYQVLLYKVKPSQLFLLYMYFQVYYREVIRAQKLEFQFPHIAALKFCSLLT